MRRPSILLGALLGLGSAVVVTLVGYLGNQATGLPSVPFAIVDWLARVLPGPIVSFGIDLMVTIIRTLQLGPIAGTAKLAEAAIGVGQFVVLGAVFGAILALLRRSDPGRGPVYGLLGGFILLVAVGLIKFSLGFGPAGVALDLLWLAVLLVGWGWSLDMLLYLLAAERPAAEPSGEVSRRRFLYLAGSAGLAVVLGILGLAAYLRQRARVRVAPAPSATPAPSRLESTNGPAASPPNAVLAARIPPAPGTRPEYTPTKDFYRIDINISPPAVVTSTNWRLQLDGLVDRPLSLSLEDLRSRPSVSQVITLSCISNPIGGDLISTSRWTGVPVKAILSEAGLKGKAAYLNIQSADGFYESLSIDEAMDERVLLVYDMDGAPLPAEHGFPLRIYIPNHYGMKQPKWITNIHVSDQWGTGYWVDRGWSKAANVNTTSVIDTVVTGEPGQKAGTAAVGGIAYAGARGISKVEVQLDEGPWVQAQLLVPPLSPLTWVQWRYDFPYDQGVHTYRVRAYDGQGALQVLESHDVLPNGATGVHTRVLSL